MASAQVLPNSGASSRKEHLEAGKRRLEEFRKKRAEGRAKKPPPNGQQQSNDLGQNDKQPQESELIRPIDSDGAVTSERECVSTTELSGFATAGDTQADFGSSNGTQDSMHSTANSMESADEVKQTMNDSVDFNSSLNLKMGGAMLSGFNGHRKRMDSAPWQSESLSMDYGLDTRSSSNHVSPYSALPEAGSRQSRPSFLESLNVPRIPSVSHFPITESGKVAPFMSKSSKVHSVDALPSFTSHQQFTGSETMGPPTKSGTQNLHGGYEVPAVNYSVSVNNKGESLSLNAEENSVKKKPDFPSLKHNEDFTALEQHIEDLTQEKYSLQRALDASQTLSESLATENSSLTDSYNHQGAVVNQLKSDMQSLQEEIRTQLLELESVKVDYANAQLECNAADERAKILASEVIGLEEKALRLRSNELKLEKQLENSNAEITSYKKKVSSLEKDCQDFQSTIDSLQEEKKLLQSKLRKTSMVGKPVDVNMTPIITKDVSTSTEDIDDVYGSVTGEIGGSGTSTSNLEMQDTASIPLSRTSTSPLVPENIQYHPSAASATIPPEHLRMVDNINSLISELALEKEELMQALAVESSQSSKLKYLNEELSRKLEVQTQRLELLTTQTMASENIPTRQSDSRTMTDSTVYADEGDEVVERVLGWIMKLFPGGPSKRRTSKLL